MLTWLLTLAMVDQLSGGESAVVRRWSCSVPVTELQWFSGGSRLTGGPPPLTVLGSGLDDGSRLSCMYEVPMIGSGSEPIIGLAHRSV
ncbi:hypothetical protein Tco_0606722 [Tanacetum coccineum]